MFGNISLHLSILIFTTLSCRCDTENPQHYNVIILGATGDLAGRYLWKSFFELFSKKYEKGKVHFTIYGCSRKDAEEGRRTMSQLLLSSVSCSDEACRRRKKLYVESIQFHQLKTIDHYKELALKINENTQTMYGIKPGDSISYEVGRLVFFAIPPSGYLQAAKRVDKYLRPAGRNVWMRNIIEKPLGTNFEEAENMTKQLEAYLSNEETFIIDHYLGKPIARLILPFRYFQKGYHSLWNKNFISRVEIIMKEKLDVSTRHSFYDDVGVIGDMMQNHLTEMLMLVAMNEPKDSGNSTQTLINKIELLSSTKLNDIRLGQYAGYWEESQAQTKLLKKKLLLTPTFAVALLHVGIPRWKNVPFILMSGKKLDRKASYIRILFKAKSLCLYENEDCAPSQLVFYLGGHQHPLCIFASKNLPKLVDGPGWTKVSTYAPSMLGEEFMQHICAVDTTDSYSFLMEGAIDGARHLFTDPSSLLEMWKVWTTPTIEPDELITYAGGSSNLDVLRFYVTNNQLKSLEESQISLALVNEMTTKELFRGQPLFTSHRFLVVKKLALSIANNARSSIALNGVFNMALSGGETAKLLFKELCVQDIDWGKVHIWMVDERCVPLHHSSSNFKTLQDNLLTCIDIPHYQVHPMPVDQWTVPCQDDAAEQMYETSLKTHLISNRLDYVVLGVGSDGHTASLFPGMWTLAEKEHWVLFSPVLAEATVPQRMTLTLPLLNTAQQISVLVVGSHKQQIIHALSSGIQDASRYPISGLHSNNISWYIDSTAYGKNLTLHTSHDEL